jgi:hypothetical protein
MQHVNAMLLRQSTWITRPDKARSYLVPGKWTTLYARKEDGKEQMFNKILEMNTSYTVH